jgi:hypothetical protein
MVLTHTKRITPLGWMLAFSAVCLLGWLLFLFNLGKESMWHDEWIVWSFAKQPDITSFFAQYPLGTTHPPLYFLWVWLWVKFTGTQDITIMRLASALLSILALAMAYRVGRDWFKSRWTGVGAAAFLAVSGMVIYYARELRMYPLVVLLSLVSWWFLLKFIDGVGAHGGASLRNLPKNRYFWLYALSVAALMLTHYFTVFMIAVQGLVVLLFYRRTLIPLIAAYSVAFLLFLPWMPTALEQFNLSTSRAVGEGVLPAGTTDPTTPEVIIAFVERYSAGQPAFFLTLLGIGLMLGWNTPARYRRHLIIAALWLFGSIMIIFTANLISVLYNARYLMMALPALALIVGVGVDRLPVQARPGLIGIVIVVGLFSHSEAFLPAHTPHRQLLGVVNDNYRPGDRIWYNLDYGARGSSLSSEPEYYLGVVYPQLNSDEFVWEAPREFEDVKTTPRVWDVRSHWIPMPESIEDVLEDGRRVTEEYRFGVFSARLYEAPPENEPAQFGDLFTMNISPARTDYRPGETVMAKTWWQTLQPVPVDYSYGLYVRDAAGNVLAQADQGLIDGKTSTSQWAADDEMRLITPQLTLPADIAPGEYGLWLSVYYWQNPQPLAIQAPEGFIVDRGANVIQIAAIRVLE